MIVFFAKGLYTRLAGSKVQTPPSVCIVDPGFSSTSLSRDAKFPVNAIVTVLEVLFARSAEKSSRTIVHGAVSNRDPRESEIVNGKYLASCRVKEESDYVWNQEGVKIEKRIWASHFNVLINRSVAD